MSEEKILTKEIAEQFLADEDSVDLSEFTKIEDAAAESLSKHEGESLDLYGLAELSDAAAESLSKHKGFGKHYEGCLYLSALTELSDTAAESLSEHYGPLDLSGLTSLGDAAAESLSKHEGRLSLDGLTSLSDASAESLSKHGNLYLNGLTSLSDASAESLSTHKHTLHLSGLTSLSDALVESLSKHEGWLRLPPELEEKVFSKCERFELLTEEVAEGFTCAMELYGGDLYDAGYDDNTREEISDELRKYRSITDQAAVELSGFEFDLYLDGLTMLSDAAAESLGSKPVCFESNQKNYEPTVLSLSGLTELSETAAKSLSNFKGSLISPEELEEQVAQYR